MKILLNLGVEDRGGEFEIDISTSSLQSAISITIPLLNIRCSSVHVFLQLYDYRFKNKIFCLQINFFFLE